MILPSKNKGPASLYISRVPSLCDHITNLAFDLQVCSLRATYLIALAIPPYNMRFSAESSAHTSILALDSKYFQCDQREELIEAS